MAIVTFTGGQSSSATNGQSTTYIVQKCLQHVPGCPDTLAQSMLQDVLLDFYKNTSAWRDIVGPYNIAAGVDTYQLNPVDQFKQVQNVYDVWLFPGVANGNQRQWLRPTTRKIIGTDIGNPYSFFVQPATSLVLYPKPDISYGRVLYVYASLIPVINTPQLPDFTMAQHFDALHYGTLSRLFRMPKRPWSDKELATEYDRMYRKEKLQARDEANRSYTGVDTPIRFPRFAGSGSQRFTRGV